MYPGNNPTAVVRALTARATVWDEPVLETGVSASGPGTAPIAATDKWTEQFVWKPTWNRLKGCPSEYRRWAKDVKNRQVSCTIIR